MDEDETKDSRPTTELHHVQLDRPGHLQLQADTDAGTKTFHMAPRQELGWPDGYDSGEHWPVYEPFTGLRTAAVLGGLMLMVLVYILYKTRCGGRIGRRRWTSKDRLFVERYKRKVQERYILDASARYRRRDTIVRTASRNVDPSAAADKQAPPSSVPIVAELRPPPNQNDTGAQRHRPRHHSVNDVIMTHLDVRVPLRIGQEAGRRRQASGASRPTTDGPRAPVQSQTVVEACQSAGVLNGKVCPPLPRAVPVIDVAARRTRRGRAHVAGDLRRCRSLDNVLNAAFNANNTAVQPQRTSVMLTNAN